jgi:hypothetical protein
MKVTDIKEFIARETGCSLDALIDTALIELDLGITGDDAWELLDAIHKEYKTDLSNFDFTLYFAPEAGPIENKEYGYYPVTVQTIVDSVISGKWVSPQRNASHYQRVRASIRKRNMLIVASVSIGVILLIIWQYINA